MYSDLFTKEKTILVMGFMPSVIFWFELQSYHLMPYLMMFMSTYTSSEPLLEPLIAGVFFLIGSFLALLFSVYLTEVLIQEVERRKDATTCIVVAFFESFQSLAAFFSPIDPQTTFSYALSGFGILSFSMLVDFVPISIARRTLKMYMSYSTLCVVFVIISKIILLERVVPLLQRIVFLDFMIMIVGSVIGYTLQYGEEKAH